MHAYYTCWAQKWPPTPPSARAAPAQPWRPSIPGLVRGIVAAEEASRKDRRAAEAAGDAVDGARELLASHGGGIEQRQLTARLRAERGGGHADEAHRLHEPLAGEQRRRAPVDLQAVLGRITRVAARQRAEVRPPELQRHPTRGQTLRPQ